MAKFTNEELEELVDALRGSTDTLDMAIKELFGDQYGEDQMDDSDHDYIDNEIFLCTDCGWWCEISDESQECLEGERICHDCQDVR